MSRTCPRCHSGLLTGHEVLGVYDGVLYWSCDECKHAWPRNFVNESMAQKSAEYAAMADKAGASAHKEESNAES